MLGCRIVRRHENDTLVFVTRPTRQQCAGNEADVVSDACVTVDEACYAARLTMNHEPSFSQLRPGQASPNA